MAQVKKIKNVGEVPEINQPTNDMLILPKLSIRLLRNGVDHSNQLRTRLLHNLPVGKLQRNHCPINRVLAHPA